MSLESEIMFFDHLIKMEELSLLSKSQPPKAQF